MRKEPEPNANMPLAELLKSKGFAASEPTAAAPPPPGGIDLSKSAKIVVRKERKGRGGKTVTLVSGIELPPARLEEVARAMRHALGCGSACEGQLIIVQGDIAPRVQAWLQAHGAKRVILGTSA